MPQYMEVALRDALGIGCGGFFCYAGGLRIVFLPGLSMHVRFGRGRSSG